jgi:hypothetical protein
LAILMDSEMCDIVALGGILPVAFALAMAMLVGGLRGGSQPLSA